MDINDYITRLLGLEIAVKSTIPAALMVVVAGVVDAKKDDPMFQCLVKFGLAREWSKK